MYTGYLAPASNRASWTEAVQLVDNESGDNIEISGCRITLTVRNENRNPVLTASTDDGTITLPQTGTFQWDFSETQMSGLCPGASSVRGRISQDDRVVQLLIGNINIMEGIDTQ